MNTTDMAARDRLIIALDQDTREEARALVARLGGAAQFYKVGLASLLRGGLELVRELRGLGKNVFLDLKMYDVPNTVTEAVAAAAALGVKFTTVHGVAGNAAAARARLGTSELKILAVTALTSMSEADVRALNGLTATASVQEHVVGVARRMMNEGAHGVIASPLEVAALRAALPRNALIVTPGIRLKGGAADDQKRVATPYESIKTGADYLVVGRPIYRSADPAGKVEECVAEIARGLADRTL